MSRCFEKTIDSIGFDLGQPGQDPDEVFGPWLRADRGCAGEVIFDGYCEITLSPQDAKTLARWLLEGQP